MSEVYVWHDGDGTTTDMSLGGRLRRVSADAAAYLRENWKVTVPLAAVFLVLFPTAVVQSSIGSMLTLFGLSARVKVGAYYYPWYGDGDFHDGHYIRSELDPAQYPTLGEYDDTDSTTIAQHIAWSHQANIDVWVTSWWGAGSTTDTTLLNYILPHEDFDLEFAIHYETLGLTEDFSSYDGVGDDIAYLAETYFSQSNYLMINGRPVIFVYEAGTAFLAGSLYTLMSYMREAASEAGYDIYIVADAAYGDPVGQGLATFEALEAGISMVDALTTYDTYGAIGVSSGYAGQSAVDSFFKMQATWKKAANKQGRGFIPTVTPGFNDMAVRDGNYPLSRKLTSSSAFGTLFKAMLKQATRMVDQKAEGLMMVTSFNEWHEDTQIEPVLEQDGVSVDSNYGTGLEYEAYGERYLNILKNYT